MNPRLNRTQVVFLSVVKCDDPAERAAALERECAGDPQLRKRVEELLRGHDQVGQFLGAGSDPADSGGIEGPETSDSTPENAEPPLAGRYKLLQQLGEGGMGVVWLAEQREPVKRKVAVKLIRAGMDSRAVLARFEAERQALALMDHPNIAKVLDGGTTSDGRPYFVMELVKGIPLIAYCDERGLSTEERLNLFCEVCAAVQHAHQKGIIHRDLKPGNVLVVEQDGRPVPKVIDFGLAKALGEDTLIPSGTIQTAIGAVLGTPLYMAPEQVGVNLLDVDTRADIYSLGVILYELLTGTTPLDAKKLRMANWDELRRLIREEEPPPPSRRLSLSDTLPAIAERRSSDPSRLSRLVRNDLDWVVMKALEKDRNRRYPTASDFAADVKRFLACEPVEACPPSKLYRLKRFVRRNRGAVLAAGLVLLALVAGLAGTTWGMIRAEEARRDEAQQRREADEARLRESERADAEAKATKLAVAKQQEAENARKLIQKEFQRAEAIHLFLQNVLLEVDGPFDTSILTGNVAEDLQYPDLLRRAAKRLDGQFAELPLVEAYLRQTLGNAFSSLGLQADALPQKERAFALYKVQMGADSPNTLYAMTSLVSSLSLTGNSRRAVALGEENLERHMARFGPDDPNTLIARLRLAKAYLNGNVPRGVRELDECARQYQTVFKPDDLRTFVVAIDVSEGYLSAGSGGKALPIMTETLQKLTARYGPDNKLTLHAERLLGRAALYANDPKRSVMLLEDTVTRLTKIRGPAKPDTLEAQAALATAYAAAGSASKAVAVLEELLPRCRERYRYNAFTLSLTRDLIWAYSDTDQHQKAIELGRAESRRIRAFKQPSDGELAGMLTALGRALVKAGKAEEAKEVMREALNIRKRIQPNTWFEATAQAVMGKALLSHGDFEDAETLLLAGFHGLREHPNELAYPHIQKGRLVEVCDDLIELYKKTNRPDEVTRWQRERADVAAAGKK